MSRFSYFLFNLLLICLVYGIIYFMPDSAKRHSALVYTATYFSAPFVVVNFVMSIYCLFRWFMTQNHDISKEGITFLHATWFVTLLTFCAYKLIDAGSIVKLFSSFR